MILIAAPQALPQDADSPATGSAENRPELEAETGAESLGALFDGLRKARREGTDNVRFYSPEARVEGLELTITALWNLVPEPSEGLRALVERHDIEMRRDGSLERAELPPDANTIQISQEMHEMSYGEKPVHERYGWEPLPEEDPVLVMEGDRGEGKWGKFKVGVVRQEDRWYISELGDPEDTPIEELW